MGKQAILAFFICLATFPAFSQGCSDAGGCTIGYMKNTLQPDSAYQSAFIAGVSAGLGEQDVLIISPFLEANFKVLKNTWLNFRTPFVFTSGNLGSTADVGDLFAGVTQRVWETEEADLRVMATIKIPQNQADKKDDDRLPLPMPYQSSLGTTDLIVGVSYKRNRILVSAAYQHVLKQNNQNGFLTDLDPENLNYQAYFNSQNLERANDVLLRAEYTMPVGNHLLSVGVLPVYHLSEDTYQNLAGERVKAKGSDGLTLNITGNYLYKLSNRAGLRFTAGAPVITRDVRPDGLTRFAVGVVNYELLF